jgi:hypothetical protein
LLSEKASETSFGLPIYHHSTPPKNYPYFEELKINDDIAII